MKKANEKRRKRNAMIRERKEYEEKVWDRSPQSTKEQMASLKPVGFWKPKGRWPSNDPDMKYPDPHDFVDESWDASEMRIVLAYVDFEGHKRQYWRGYSNCRMCEKNTNGTTEPFDDVYRWPEGFAHYIRDHHVKPPQDFIDHCLARAAELGLDEVA